MINGARNTIVFEADESLQASLFETFSTSHSPESASNTLRELLCCFPKVEAPGSLDYRNVFRVIIMQFIDVHSFDMRSVKKTCVHIAHPDGKRLIPFDTCNLFYRDSLEHTVVQTLRADREGQQPMLKRIDSLPASLGKGVIIGFLLTLTGLFASLIGLFVVLGL